jgi:tight adherence protein C
VSTLLLAGGIAGIFCGLFLALAAVGVLSDERTGISKSLAVLDAFTAAPSELRAELEPSFEERVLAPLLRKTLALGRKLTPADHADRIRQRLEYAGNPPRWTVDKVISLKVVGSGVALLLALLVTVLVGLGIAPTLVICASAAGVGFLAPDMYLYQKAYDRTAQLQKALPDALDLLTISVESGLGFDAALSQVARNTEGPLADELARVLQEMQIGMGRGAALRALGDRTRVADVKSFVSAIVQADALGIPVAQVLRLQSREIRTKRRQRAEEQAQKVAIKILVPMIFCVLPCLFIAVLGPAAVGVLESFRAP